MSPSPPNSSMILAARRGLTRMQELLQRYREGRFAVDVYYRTWKRDDVLG